ncbi:MAG: type II toxin-antitoxin system RelE/ParE family toxin [Acidobacteriia bacterium]|nr:type II toxin-antitoxin system RelE/ParE family toxin [Terriglobia bacterium]
MGGQTQGMSAYQLTPQALDDLLDIWIHIANDNPRAADAVEAALLNACALLAKSPLSGRAKT